MTVPPSTLEGLAAAGPAVWLRLTAADFAAATVPPIEPGALKGFVQRVREWYDTHTGEEAKVASTWIRAVVNPALGLMPEAALAESISGVTSFTERLELLRLLFETPARHRLSRALEATAQTLTLPELPPSEPDERARWGSHIRLLVDLIGAADPDRARSGFAALVGTIPAWALADALATIGKLTFLELYADALAFSLLEGPSPTTAEALASALADQPSDRLLALLQFLVAPETPMHAPNRPIAVAVDPWLGETLARLGKRNPDAALRVRGVLDSRRVHHADIVSVFRGYLDATPLNHEELFELFSSYREERRPGPLPSDWGMPSVTLSSGGSMRQREADDLGGAHETEPPDFPWEEALRSIGIDALEFAVRAQPSPAFALTYLELARRAGHPQATAVYNRVVASPNFRRALLSLSGGSAVRVLLKLADGERHAHASPEPLDDVLPTLLARVPAGSLQTLVHHYRVGARHEDAFSLALRSRLKQSRTLPEAIALFKAVIEHVGPDATDPWLDELDLAALAPPDRSSSEAFEQWVGEILSDAPGRLLERLFGSLSTSDLTRIYEDRRFGVQPIEHHRFDPERRLRAKVAVLAALAASNRDEARRCIVEHQERDFLLFSASTLRTSRFGDYQPSEVASRWLTVVTDLDGDNAARYINTLLSRMVLVVRMDRVEPSIHDVVPFLARWMVGRDLTVGEFQWSAIADHLKEVGPTDYQGAALIAGADLPSDEAPRRTFREKTVEAVRERMRRASGISRAGPLDQLYDLLAREAPDLAQRLFDYSKDPSP